MAPSVLELPEFATPEAAASRQKERERSTRKVVMRWRERIAVFPK
jgi:hypothetical protein